MKRALILIVTLTVLCVAVAVSVDGFQRRTARRYLAELPGLRQAVTRGDLAEAGEREALLFARWQGDTMTLNLFISHHHTRAVTSALMQLATAVEMGWQDEALKAVDLLEDALEHVCQDGLCGWGHLL